MSPGEPLRPAWALSDPLLCDYYDTEWGFPLHGERHLFERLSLEAFQSGLSWLTILRKRPAFRAAFADFEPDAVAAYGERDVARLLADAGIVRNRAKVLATIANAAATVELRADEGLDELIWSFRPDPARAPDPGPVSSESKALAKELRRRGFVFVGPTTMFALMEAVGMIDVRVREAARLRSAS
jgi:DNA-3-methyladenine glycosylase I